MTDYVARERFLRNRAVEHLTGVPARLRDAAEGSVWFWKPQAPGGRTWRSWSVAWVGHDEYSRRTLVLGFPWTGRAIIALWFCGNAACYAESLDAMDRDHD